MTYIAAMFEMDGKIALVTGASRGIGEACAVALDAAGAQVVLSGRTVEDLERVAASLNNNPLIIPADLMAPGAGTKLAADAVAAAGAIDVCVNNAGIPMRRTPEQLTEEDVDAVFALNVRSLLMLSVGLGETMKSRGGGSIVNISSIAGLAGPLGRVAYAGTKGAVDAMTRALAADWGKHNIRVNSVAPGIIATAIWEESRATVPGLIEELAASVSLRRWGASDDIADVVLFLASDAARYVTGETIAVDGGMARVNGGGAPEFTKPDAE